MPKLADKTIKTDNLKLVAGEKSHQGLHNCDFCELEDIIESSHDGLFITDGHGVILRVNSAWERIAGIQREFAIGKCAKDLVEQKWYTESAAMAAIRDRQKATIMLEMLRGEKIGQKIMATAIPIWGEDGEIRRVVANIRDITEILYLKQLLEKTQRLNELYAAELEHMKRIDLVARSESTKRIKEIVARVAGFDVSVLITGESGVGKEVFANAIHQQSQRSKGPLIKVNSGAIPETLLESELFGYDYGAFTGARKQGKPGMFELAHEGTLFLDEIGDIPYSLQGKLLRALQDREIMRIGGLKPTYVDVRIVAATNKNLEEMVKKGTFRDDLYYRLNVVSIDIPPLRERKEDIPIFVLHFLDKMNKKHQYNKRIAPEVVDVLMLYPWPGNVRELENVVERMIIMTEGDEITIKHLPIQIKSQITPEAINVTGDNSFKTTIEQTEMQLLMQALQNHKSTRAIAKAMKINQSTVVRKLKKYNLSSPADGEKHQ
ncbi:MAG TPA: sigma 54-interacting transcriptional regulator [Syntrophales bacterium]|nr:sigma 54-interacting transcriptional regulator [Syntrophales bacterium]